MRSTLRRSQSALFGQFEPIPITNITKQIIVELPKENDDDDDADNVVDSFAGTVEKLPGGLCARTRDYFVPRSTPGWLPTLCCPL